MRSVFFSRLSGAVPRLLSMLTFAAALGFAPASGYAATVTAASCAQTAVAAAVGSANRNDTVTVPAGTCAWSSPVRLTKGITLTGAGVGSTVITSSGSSVLISIIPDATTIANSEIIKTTGFTFDGANSASILINVQGASGITGTKPYRYLLIGDNKFQNANPSSSTLAGAAIQANADTDGQIRGVIYHNTFDRCNIILRVFSNNDTREWANTAFNQLGYGTDDNLYFEDNAILYSSSYSGDNPGWIETGQGGRLVARYNTWNLANATTPQEIWDIHGFQNWTGVVNSGQTSTMVVEYYGNTLSNMGTYRWVNHRGSWGLFFNNLLTGTGGNGIDMDQYAGCPSQISPTPTNYIPVVNNTYVFNNTQNGNVKNMGIGPGGAACGVAENTHWWNYNASCTASSCTSGIGRGTSPPTGSCTTGVGYWVAGTPTPSASSSVVQGGAFYKCTATNTWTPYYSPYTYPHPLRATAAPGLAAPTNLSATAQ
jgi:hypothetical protein